MADGQPSSRSIVEPIQPEGRGFDIGLMGGILIGFLGLTLAAWYEGASPEGYFDKAAIGIVFGGTLGATMAAFGWPQFRRMPLVFFNALTFAPVRRTNAVRTIVGFAEKARREGLLVLEDDLAEVDHEFLRRGLQLVVDGTDPELVKDILQTEVDSLAEQHERNSATWMTAGGFSPTFGIVGAVMGLILVLGNLDDPTAIGPAIAVAFVATLYGVGFSNLVYIPVGMRVKLLAEDDLTARELMIEGILAIQSGDNPRIVEEKLLAFLDADDRLEFELERDSGQDFDLAA